MKINQGKLIQLLVDYELQLIEQDKSQREMAALFKNFITHNPSCCERSCAHGHLTGSAWLVSQDQQRVLLTHHKKLNCWLQLGGHADGDDDLAAVALREAYEESGLKGLVLQPRIFDLDRHWIPARSEEIAHWHYDMRFVVFAQNDEQYVVSDESFALAWWSIEALAEELCFDASVVRMAKKWCAQLVQNQVE